MKRIWDVFGKTDQQLFLTVYKQQNNWKNKLFLFLSLFGGMQFQVAFSLLLLALPATRSAGLAYGMIQLIVTIIVQLLKRIVSRMRPYNRLENIEPLRREKDHSFPSGHTAAIFSTAVILNTYLPGAAAIFYGLAMLVGYSRVYIGVHYPSDVIAGSIVGVCMTQMLMS